MECKHCLNDYECAICQGLKLSKYSSCGKIHNSVKTLNLYGDLEQENIKELHDRYKGNSWCTPSRSYEPSDSGRRFAEGIMDIQRGD